MALASQDRPLGVQEAYDALESFGRSAGRVPLLLLLHAAVPQSFRADLVNLLKQNFLASEAGTDMTVDADVLLSPLVQPAAGNYYRLDPEVRRHCLALLDAAYRDRAVRRSVEVAWFLMAYAEALEEQAGLALDPLLAEYLDVQRWVAASFIEPGAAAATFARAIADRAASGETTASALLGSITAAISVPLSGQEALLTYAQGLDAVERGDADAARRLLEWTRDNALVVGGVTLRPGGELLARLEGPGNVVGTATQSRPSTADPGAAPETAGAPAQTVSPVPRFNVPPAPVQSMIGRLRELELARTLLTRPAPADIPRQGPRVVRIVGDAGMGKWTLANELVNRTDVPERFPDGIVWLGDDGNGYPTRALAAFALSVGVSDLLDDRQLLRTERLNQMLANRRALLVVEQRSASDIAGTVLANAGPQCAVLHLVEADRTDNPNRVVLQPFTAEETNSLIGRTDQALLSATPELSVYAEGSPLLLTLAITAWQTGVPLPRREPEMWATVDRLIALIWRRLPTPVRDVLRALNALSPEHRTLFAKGKLGTLPVSGDEGAVAILQRFHLADDLGDGVRVHPGVRAALIKADLHATEEAEATETPPSYEAEKTGYVYLSYADADAKTASKLQEALESAGLQTRGRNRPDKRTSPQIRYDIDNASAIVIVLSSRLTEGIPAHLEAEWEWTVVQVANRRPLSTFVVPVAVDDVTASSLELPALLRTINWGRAPGGIPSTGTIEALRAIVRESQLSRGAEPADRSAASLRTDDYALVVVIARYPGLKLEFPELRTAAGLMIDWLSSPEGGGMPAENVNLLMQNETSQADAREPSYDHVGKALASLAENVQPSRRNSSPRRLYLCFYGAVVTAARGEVELLTADGTHAHTRTVDILGWRRRFSDGPFEEVVCIVEGVSGLSASAVTTEAARSPSRPGEAVSTFTLIGVSPSGTSQSAGNLTAVLLDGLRGAGASFGGRITSGSLASFIDKRMRGGASSDIPPQVPVIEYEGEILFNDGTPPPAAT